MKKLWEKVKKVILWKPDMRLVAVLAVTALLLLLIPLLRMTIYTIPWYDDYGYASNVKNFLALDYTLANAWKGALYCVKTQWYAWQGTFSSCFFNRIFRRETFPSPPAFLWRLRLWHGRNPVIF